MKLYTQTQSVSVMSRAQLVGGVTQSHTPQAHDCHQGNGAGVTVG